jgi:hypothetical protein
LVLSAAREGIFIIARAVLNPSTAREIVDRTLFWETTFLAPINQASVTLGRVAKRHPLCPISAGAPPPFVAEPRPKEIVLLRELTHMVSYRQSPPSPSSPYFRHVDGMGGVEVHRGRRRTLVA